MKNHITTLLTALLLLSFAANAQQFLTNYGTPQIEKGFSGLPLDTPGSADRFVVLGNSFDAPLLGNSEDIYFARLDGTGNINPTTQIIGNDTEDQGLFIEKVMDWSSNTHTGYIITGSTHYGNPNQRDLLMVRTDLLGNVICARQFGGQGDDEVGFSVKQDEDGNFIAVGKRIDAISGTEGIYAVKMDMNCNFMWAKTYYATENDAAYSVATVRNVVDATGNILSQAYALTGRAQDDIFILLMDKNGTMITEARYDLLPNNQSAEVAYCIQQDHDGGLIVTGDMRPMVTPFPPFGNQTIFVHKTDITLNPMWTNAYEIPNSEAEFAKYISLVHNDPSTTNPDGYILTGRSYDAAVTTPGIDQGQAFLLRLDNGGNPMWANNYLDSNYEGSHGNRVEVSHFATSTIQTPTFFVTGYSFAPQQNVPVPLSTHDVLAFQTDYNGNLATTSATCQAGIPTEMIPIQPVPSFLGTTAIESNLSFLAPIMNEPHQEAQEFCASNVPCPDTTFMDLGVYMAACDEVIDATHPVFSAMSPNCSNCTWEFQPSGTAVVFPINVGAYPPNTSIVLTCFDAVSCCETRLIIQTDCCDDPCANDWVNLNYSTTDPCCASLDINLFEHCDLVFKRVVAEVVTAGVDFASPSIGGAYTGLWTMNNPNAQTAELLPTSAVTAPNSYPALFDFCLYNYGTSTSQQIDVHYVVCDAAGVESIACTESFFFQCQPIQTGPCLEIKSDSVYCDANGNYFIDFCVTNISTDGCAMTQLDLFLNSPFITTPQTFSGLNILPSDCFCATVPLTGLGGAIPAAGDLVSIGFMSDCCPNFVMPLSLTLPDCQPCDPCQNDWVTQLTNTGDPCCASLDINLFDDCNLVFKKFVTEIVTPGVNYSSANLGALYTGNWSMNPINPQIIEWGPVISPAFMTSYPNLINFCLENVGGIMPQQVDVHYVVCDVNGQDSIACTESLFFQCEPIQTGPCLEWKSDSVYCDSDGNYLMDFCVINNSLATSTTNGCIMTDLNVAVNAPFNLTPSAFTGLSILPGECFCATIAIGSSGILPPAAGDVLNITLYSDCCPNEPITNTIILPDCQPCDPCENDWVSIDYDTADPCCASLDMVLFDDCGLTFKKYVTEIITPGVNYSSANLGAAYTTNWITNSVNPQTMQWMPTTPPAYMTSYPDLVNFCLENNGSSSVSQVDVHYVVCDVNGQDSIACTESFFLDCEPIDGPCIELKSDSVYCDANGDYFFDYCITNLSPNCNMTQINLFSSSTYYFTPDIITGLNIPPGGCYCGTSSVNTWGTNPLMAGDSIHLCIVSDCCPNEILNHTIVLPDCCETTEIELGTGLDQAVNSLDPYWSVIADPIASTPEPRPANTIPQHPSWSAPFAGTQWISAIPSNTGAPQGDYVFQRCFCMDTTIVNPQLQLGLLADDNVDIYFNGTYIGGNNSSTLPVGVMTNDATLFQPGNNCIQARLSNNSSVNTMGLNITGTVSADAGLLQDTCCEAKAIITGYKWHDYTADGIWQDFEPGIPNWPIYLSNGDQVTTDANGFYYFCVAPGTYTVSENLPLNWVQTYPATPGTYTLTLAAGDVANDIHFGNKYYCPFTIDLISPSGTTYSPTGNITIQAAETVTSSLPIGNANQGSIIIQAGNEVTLEPGFEVKLGVECTIGIEGCGTDNVEKEEEQHNE